MEIENMEVSQRIYIYEREIELKNKYKILEKLDIAEAFNYAYIGSQPDKKRSNARQYKNWRNDLYRQINPEYQPNTIWCNITKKGKF